MPTQRLVRVATIKQLRDMSFSAGSMGPKVEAACRFVAATGRRAVIGMLDDAQGLLDGTSGTTILPDAPVHLEEGAV
jgi:carbamate kinase